MPQLITVKCGIKASLLKSRMRGIQLTNKAKFYTTMQVTGPYMAKVMTRQTTDRLILEKYSKTFIFKVYAYLSIKTACLTKRLLI